ncbi:MAG TPA: hypothetical protein VNC81_09025 [Xanthobacteraceae bacterium]|jgi:hypothetical protein|nr:hypothetical protein [Xanthobacteraceae bacterium]
MSSPKAAAAKTARRPTVPGQPAAKRVQTSPAAKPASKPANGVSADAKRLAGEIERALASGQRDLLSTEALQVLMAAVCKVYGARVEAGEQLLPLPERGGATATDVMVTASGLLKAANLAVFELGMWQSWTGR